MMTEAERRHMIETRKRAKSDKWRLWVRDGWQTFDIYSVPVDALILNADNRRFRAERMWAEAQLGRALDPDNIPDDERSIESLLLDVQHRIDGPRVVGKASDDYEALRNDWLRRGQEAPFWILPDGTVRNGNRRLAMIKRQQRAGGDSGLQYVDAIIINPADIDEVAMLEMEQHEQMTSNFKVRYNDLDYLLALKDAADSRHIDWFEQESINEVAGELQTMVEKSQREVVRDLYAIKYMEAFLADSGQDHEYHLLLRQLERFRAIGEMMLRVETNYPLETDRILDVMFAAVRAGKPHGDIRTIRQIFREERELFDRLAEEVEDVQGGWSPADGVTIPAPSVTEATTEDEDEPDDDQDAPGPDVPNYPKAEVATAIEVAIDNFRANRQQDTVQTLREVLNRLEAISDERLQLALEDAALSEVTRSMLLTILNWADRYRGWLDGDD